MLGAINKRIRMKATEIVSRPANLGPTYKMGPRVVTM